MNIYERMIEARKKVTYVKKGGKIFFPKKDGGGIEVSASKHDDVVDACRDTLNELGVMTRLNMSDLVRDGGALRGTATMTFICADDPNDSYFVNTFFVCAGNDSRDPGKVASFAKKSFLLNELLLVTGEDEEKEYSKKREMASAEMMTAETLNALILPARQVRVDMDVFVARLCRYFGVADRSQIPADKVDEVSDLVQKTVDAKKEKKND